MGVSEMPVRQMSNAPVILVAVRAEVLKGNSGCFGKLKFCNNYCTCYIFKNILCYVTRVVLNLGLTNQGISSLFRLIRLGRCF